MLDPTARHLPTSVYLAALLDNAPKEDASLGSSAPARGQTSGSASRKERGAKDAGPTVTIRWIMEQLGERSFGLTFFVMAVVAVIPGGSTIIGVLIIWPAVQLAIGRQTPLLPGFLGRRTIGIGRLSRTIQFVVPRLRWIEKLIRPRWPAVFARLRRPTGVLVLLVGVTLALPLPFSHIVPALTIMLLAVAFLEEDGIALLLATLMGLASLAFSAVQVWGAVEFVDWIERLLA